MTESTSTGVSAAALGGILLGVIGGFILQYLAVVVLIELVLAIGPYIYFQLLLNACRYALMNTWEIDRNPCFWVAVTPSSIFEFYDKGPIEYVTDVMKYDVFPSIFLPIKNIDNWIGE